MEIPAVIREKAPQMEIMELEKYLNKVWALLDAMKPGDLINIAKNTRPETRELFMECIKLYMREHEWQNGLSFTRGFVDLQKYDISFIKGNREPLIERLNGASPINANM